MMKKITIGVVVALFLYCASCFWFFDYSRTAFIVSESEKTEDLKYYNEKLRVDVVDGSGLGGSLTAKNESIVKMKKYLVEKYSGDRPRYPVHHWNRQGDLVQDQSILHLLYWPLLVLFSN